MVRHVFPECREKRAAPVGKNSHFEAVSRAPESREEALSAQGEGRDASRLQTARRAVAD